jgi:tetratricopeptide (TPR) repeat protein
MRLRVLMILSALALTPVVARAGNKEAARADYLEGNRRYDLNEFDAALAAFKRAYLEYEDPAFLFNIAQCHRQLGQKSDAVKFYRSYLRKVPDAPNRAEVERLVATLEAQLSEDQAKQAAERERREKEAAAAAAAANAAHVSTAVSASAAPPAPPRKPAYKKWWVWTIVGVAAAGAATGIALGVTSQRSEPLLMPVTVSR